MINAMIKNTTHSLFRPQWSRCTGILLSAALMLPASWASAGMLRSRISISKQQMFLSRIDPADVQSAVFVQFKEPVAAMKAEEWDFSNPPMLTGVQAYGALPSGLWLRSRCSTPSKNLSFEECRGSVCTPLASDTQTHEKSHTLALRGEHGVYTLSAHKLGAMMLGKAKAAGDACNVSWPAWSVSARSLNRENGLSVPRSLLIVQTSQQLIWMDAVSRRVWNRMPWPANRSGAFTSVEATDSGRMLLKNSRGNSMYFDFARGQALYVQQNSVLVPQFGLGGVFADNGWSSAFQEIQLQNNLNDAHVDTTLGGIWWTRQFITWDALLVALASSKPPLTRNFAETEILKHVSWSDSSGLSKSTLLMADGSQLKTFSLEGSNIRLTQLHKFSFEDASERVKRSKMLRADDTLSAFDENGSLLVLEHQMERLQLAAGTDGRVDQLGNDLFVTQKTADKKCTITQLRAKSGESGWSSGIVLENSQCGSSIGRATHSVSIVERSDSGLVIHFLVD